MMKNKSFLTAVLLAACLCVTVFSTCSVVSAAKYSNSSTVNDSVSEVIELNTDVFIDESTSREGFFSLSFDTVQFNITDRTNTIELTFNLPRYFGSNTRIDYDTTDVSVTNDEVLGFNGWNQEIVTSPSDSAEASPDRVKLLVVGTGSSYASIFIRLGRNDEQEGGYYNNYNSISGLVFINVVASEDTVPTVGMVLDKYWWVWNIILIVILIAVLIVYFATSKGLLLPKATKSFEKALLALENVKYDPEHSSPEKMRKLLLNARAAVTSAFIACQNAADEYELFEFESVTRDIDAVSDDLGTLALYVNKFDGARIGVITDNMRHSLLPSFEVVKTTVQAKMDQEKTVKEAIAEQKIKEKNETVGSIKPLGALDLKNSINNKIAGVEKRFGSKNFNAENADEIAEHEHMTANSSEFDNDDE